MEGTRTDFRKIRILTGILVLLSMGMLFAHSVQAKGISGKTVSSGKVKLNKTRLRMKKNKTKKLKLRNSSENVVWKSSRPGVATVDSQGVVKAKKAGSCTITAKAGGHRYQCRVTVYNVGPKTMEARALQKKYRKSTNKKKIIIAGSSSIERWKSASDALSPYKVLNMGISGSTSKQWLKWYKKLIVAYKPSAVILYPGVGNELRKTCSAEETGERVCKLLKQLHRELPRVPIFYVSVYCNENLRKLWALEESCNEKVQQYCSETTGLYYIDMASALINESGDAPKPGVISKDGEHMSKKGYAIWNKTIAPTVKKKLKQKKK